MSNSLLQVDPTRTNPRATHAEDAADPRFRIEAGLRTVRGEQVLSFIVVARLPDATRGRLHGADFFTAMRDHFGDAAVDVIEGQWETTNPAWATNPDVFNRLTATTTLTEAEAAARVPTGRSAAARGFVRVVVMVANPVGGRGRFTEVVVEFRK